MRGVVCNHRYVLWPRIDQKTCLKAIVSANLEVVPLETVLDGDELHTDMAAMRQAVDRLGPDNIVCIVTTTSCFAPRAADSVVEVAKLCKSSGLGHIINNAYGVQSAALCALVRMLSCPASLAPILCAHRCACAAAPGWREYVGRGLGHRTSREEILLRGPSTLHPRAHTVSIGFGHYWGAMQVTAAWRKGRVDAVVQSTDKNFMVPVGGAVIAASKQSTALVDAVNKVWPGKLQRPQPGVAHCQFATQCCLGVGCVTSHPRCMPAASPLPQRVV